MVTFKGYNVDVPIGDIKYHVQTQAADTGLVKSMIFFNGAVIYSRKENYSDHIENRDEERQKENLNPWIDLMHRDTLRKLPKVDNTFRKFLEEKVIKAFMGGNFKIED